MIYPCDHCDGTGYQEDDQPCTECDGTGEVDDDGVDDYYHDIWRE